MLPLKDKDKPIVQKLLAAGCCARCVLRFCCLTVHAAYRRPQQVGPLLVRSRPVTGSSLPHAPCHFCVTHRKRSRHFKISSATRRTQNPKMETTNPMKHRCQNRTKTRRVKGRSWSPTGGVKSRGKTRPLRSNWGMKGRACVWRVWASSRSCVTSPRP